MALIVQKFGGTSVANIDRIREVAKIVKSEKEKNNDVVVVVSAMSGQTAKLIEYTNQLSTLTSPESLAEYDAVISSGEQITAGLLAIELLNIGYKSRSFTGWQAGIITDSIHSKSRIESINSDIFHKYIKDGIVPVVAGFQGINSNQRISTMGRGGSDTSAVAIAAALNAHRCDIYTDVDGIYTADPRIVKTCRKLKKVGYHEIIEMASLGSKVIQIRAVEMALKHKVTLQILSSFNNQPGSLLINNEEIMERRIITAVSHSSDEARVTLLNVDNTPGICAKIFKPLSDAEINIDMIIQNISENEEKANVTFTLDKANLNLALSLIEKENIKNSINYESITYTQDVTKVSVIGLGMRNHAGIAQKVFQTLAENNINIMAITTSEIKISVLINSKHTHDAVNLLHDAFELSKNKTS